MLDAVMLGQKVKTLTDAGEHAEAQHIDLEQAHGVEIVLVPLDIGAVLHGRIADRDDFRQRSAR